MGDLGSVLTSAAVHGALLGALALSVADRLEPDALDDDTRVYLLAHASAARAALVEAAPTGGQETPPPSEGPPAGTAEARPGPAHRGPAAPTAQAAGLGALGALQAALAGAPTLSFDPDPARRLAPPPPPPTAPADGSPPSFLSALGGGCPCFGGPAKPAGTVGTDPGGAKTAKAQPAPAAPAPVVHASAKGDEIARVVHASAAALRRCAAVADVRFVVDAEGAVESVSTGGGDAQCVQAVLAGLSFPKPDHGKIQGGFGFTTGPPSGCVCE